ncbi:aldo/keto reductase [Quadrisphaera sp. KR29]|uniref:aldo/keto reductase n=1 Tax=Quadrisphaera sp. KR29 TaxID=3461391 RepID=UPI00404443F9
MAAGGASWSVGDLDDASGRACLEAALDAGVQVVDTAGAYTRADSAHHNEELVADVLARRYGTASLGDAADPSHGGRPVVVTKVGHHRTGAASWDVDARPEVLHRDVRGSLRALRAEALDVCLLHWPDPAVPLEESVGALADAQREGLVRAVGVSNATAEQLDALLGAPGADGAAVAVLQTRLSALEAAPAPGTQALLALCERAGVQVMGYAPFGGPGRLWRALAARGGDAGAAEPSPLAELARAWGCSAHQLLLAWLLQAHPRLTAVVGSTRPASAREAAAAGAPDHPLAHLTAGQHRDLSAAVAELHARTATTQGSAPSDSSEDHR